MSNSGKIAGFVLAASLMAGCQSEVKQDDTPEAARAAQTAPVAKIDIVRTATKNAYFGDMHIHTKNSFDAFVFGTRSTADDAYRFAKGETIDNGTSQPISLSGPPLDFLSVTDHGEYMGIVATMSDPKSDLYKTRTGQAAFGPNNTNQRLTFLNIGVTMVTGIELEEIYDREVIDSAWAENVAAAEKHNAPGSFTTFSGYEFTAMALNGRVIDNQGANNLHRNVIFEGEAPERVFSTLDSTNPEDLWSWMNTERASGRDVLAIPHNSNVSNGLMFAGAKTDGSPMDAAYASNRMLNEPLVEITQVKGTSETDPVLSPNDEWADFELYEYLLGGTTPATKVPGSFVRQSLASGLGIEEKTGGNPYEFGLIGSSDTHVSAASLYEEDFFGKFSNDLDLQRRGSVPPQGAKDWPKGYTEPKDLISAPQYGASGLAGVWAESNTRPDIFAGMRAKETFGTSGPRMKVRMFAGDYDASVLDAPDLLEQAYARGTAMGGKASADAPQDFLVWALKDPAGTPLQRLQIVKVWNEDGTNMEAIYDVACAGGAAPDAGTNRCADNGANVDLTTCATNDETGAGELKAVWQDPDFKPGAKVAYYARVLENPKCRWSSWDAVRNGSPPSPIMNATLQDRAWGSPIWVE
jgi:hypothetical protein